VLAGLYSVAAVASPRAGIAALGASIAAFGPLALSGLPHLRLSDVVQSSALLVAAWALGYAVRTPGGDLQIDRSRMAFSMVGR